MSEMIERVGAALLRDLVGGGDEVWDAMPDHARDYYRKQARAAIAAMGEPQMEWRAEEALGNEAWTEVIDTRGEPVRGIKCPERVFVPADQIKPGTTACFRRQERGKDVFWRGVVPEFRDGYAIFTLTDDKIVTPDPG